MATLKKKTTIYLTQASDEWLTKEAQARGISKNGVLQELVNKAMKIKTA